MKYQVLFSLKNNEEIFMNAAVVIGALRVKRDLTLVISVKRNSIKMEQ